MTATEIENQATAFEHVWKSDAKRCTLIIPDAGPLNSLWAADRLALLLLLDMKIVVVDAVYDEFTPRRPADADQRLTCTETATDPLLDAG